MRKDEYKHYRKTERRLYDHKLDEARQAALLTERQEIIINLEVTRPTFGYREQIGRCSSGLTTVEQGADKQIKRNNRLWKINRELDALEVKLHILNYALAVLTSKERDIIRGKYFDGLPLEAVAEMTAYSVKQCQRVRYGAIRKVGRVLFGE